MAYSLEQIFHTEPKVIGMIEIYSNPMDRKTVQDVEKVIKEISKSLHVNLDNIPSGEVLRVYIYPTKRVFYSIFGSDVEKNTRRKFNRTEEDMLFIVGEGEIHMVSPRAAGSSYTNMIKILVKDILSEYELDEKIKKAQEKVSEKLEQKEEVDEEELEELDEEELEEPVDEETLNEIGEMDSQIEKIKEDNDIPIPEWLDLGWIMYKRQILGTAKNKEDFANFIKEKGVVSQNKISGKQSVMGDYNYSNESAAAIIEYIVENYGVRKIVDLFENPDVEKVLGISKDKFSRECKASIKKRYVSSKLKELDVQEKEDIEKIIEGG